MNYVGSIYWTGFDLKKASWHENGQWRIKSVGSSSRESSVSGECFLQEQDQKQQEIRIVEGQSIAPETCAETKLGSLRSRRQCWYWGWCFRVVWWQYNCSPPSRFSPPSFLSSSSALQQALKQRTWSLDVQAWSSPVTSPQAAFPNLY